ncbi:hypothetical protein [Frigidibacter oleivorans]|uniref:hypothetical protein n=1 Tax=Frigidibacter oleivorans TaxID=2487129 RepID=UPI000F8C5B03|nr:hypothetical protein [Frigidibacter oleivorans]
MSRAPEERVLAALARIGEARGKFIPLAVFRKAFPEPSKILAPSQQIYVVLSQGTPLESASPSILATALTNVAIRQLTRARYFSLIRLTREIGMINYDRPLGMEEILTLLQVDGDGVLGYDENMTFLFYLDYDNSGRVIELEYPKNYIN